jgi:hypothetical protein
MIREFKLFIFKIEGVSLGAEECDIFVGGVGGTDAVLTSAGVKRGLFPLDQAQMRLCKGNNPLLEYCYFGDQPTGYSFTARN